MQVCAVAWVAGDDRGPHALARPASHRHGERLQALWQLQVLARRRRFTEPPVRCRAQPVEYPFQGLLHDVASFRGFCETAAGGWIPLDGAAIVEASPSDR